MIPRNLFNHTIYDIIMDDYYPDSSTSKKRLLVPVILLMLCAISLTGAAYAYTQTFVELDDNPIDGYNYSIDYTDSNKNVLTAKLPATNEDISVVTEIVVGNSFNAYTNVGTFTRTMYVTVFTDSDKTFDLNAHVTLDSVLDKFITVSDVAIEDVAGNTATAINITFDVARVNLNTLGLTNTVEDRASYNAAYEELLTHEFNVTVTAEPN